MTIREFDPRLFRQLTMCLSGNYLGAGSDQPTPAMLAGLRRSLRDAGVDRVCDCGEPSCRSFRVAGAVASRESVRLRFRVHGELAVVCTSDGDLQHVEWLPEPPRAERHRYENFDGTFREVGICPFPE